eukprot:1723483-Prymnesium_polylepis.1
MRRGRGMRRGEKCGAAEGCDASCEFDGKFKPNVDQMRATCVDSAIDESQKRIFRIHAESVSAHRC